MFIRNTAIQAISKLTKYVGNLMGGPLDMKSYNPLTLCTIENSQLKHELKSNVLPISRVRKGHSKHRYLNLPNKN